MRILEFFSAGDCYSWRSWLTESWKWKDGYNRSPPRGPFVQVMMTQTQSNMGRDVYGGPRNGQMNTWTIRTTWTTDNLFHLPFLILQLMNTFLELFFSCLSTHTPCQVDVRCQNSISIWNWLSEATGAASLDLWLNRVLWQGRMCPHGNCI